MFRLLAVHENRSFFYEDIDSGRMYCTDQTLVHTAISSKPALKFALEELGFIAHQGQERFTNPAAMQKFILGRAILTHVIEHPERLEELRHRLESNEIVDENGNPVER